MRDFTAMLRVAMLGLACVSMAACTTPTPPPPPPTPPPPAPPPLPVVVCPNDSPYSGAQLPTVAYTVIVQLWQTSIGPKVKPEPIVVSQGHPGLCIDDDGNLHIYKKDAAEVDITLQLDTILGTWYPDPTLAFQADAHAMVRPPAFAGRNLVVFVKAKGQGYQYPYLASYVDSSHNTVQTEPGIQNH